MSAASVARDLRVEAWANAGSSWDVFCSGELVGEIVYDPEIMRYWVDGLDFPTLTDCLQHVLTDIETMRGITREIGA